MPAFLRLLVLSLTLLCFVGCTSLQPLQNAQPTTIQQAVKVGDEVQITTKGGRVFDIKVSKIDDRFLYGYDRKVFVKAPFSDIERIGVRTFSAGRTAGATGAIAAGVVAVYVILVAAGAYVLIRIFENAAD